MLNLTFLAVTIFVVVRLIQKPPDWQSARQILQSRPWTVNELIPMFFVPFALSLGVSLAVAAVNHFSVTGEAVSLRAMFILHTLAFHVSIIVVVLGMSKARNFSFATAFGVEQGKLLSNIWKGMIGYAAATPLISLSAVTADYFLDKAWYAPEAQTPVMLLTGPEPIWIKIYVIFAAILVVPVAEELLFRGAAFPALSKLFGALSSAILLSALFAASHQNMYALAPLFTMAAATTFAYMITGSIIVPITMHASFNAVNILLLYLTS
jgi:membrane protease YdiL (CAAX protease family)